MGVSLCPQPTTSTGSSTLIPVLFASATPPPSDQHPPAPSSQQQRHLIWVDFLPAQNPSPSKARASTDSGPSSIAVLICPTRDCRERLRSPEIQRSEQSIAGISWADLWLVREIN